MSLSTNFIGDALGDAVMATLAPVMAERQAHLQMSQASIEAVLVPRAPGGLSPALRAAMAARIARTSNETQLAELFERAAGAAFDAALAEIASGRTVVAADARLAALVKHLDLVTATPWMAEREAIEALRARGVDEADIVRLSQLASCISYIVRVVAGLRALGELK